MKLKKEAKKRIFGKWVESFGIGIEAGTTLSFTLGNWLYWYWLIVGAVLILWGANLQIRNEDVE